MEQQSQQPMLGGAPHTMEIESGNQRKPLNKAACVCLFIFILLSMILLVALFMVVYQTEVSGKACKTPQCLRIASSLLDSMDPDVDPCDDFNQFVCGRWGQRHIMHDNSIKNSWFVESRLLVEKRIEDFLKRADSNDEPEAVHKARRLFRSCNNFDEMSQHGLNSLVNMLMKDIGLPLIPPVDDKPVHSWIRSIALTKKTLDLDVIMGFSLGQLPSNRSVLKLVVDSPTKSHIYSLFEKKEKRSEGEEVSTSQAILKPELLKFLQYFPSVTEDEIPDIDEKLDKAANDIIHVMEGLASLEINERVVSASQNIVLQEYKLKDLQQHVDTFASGGKSKIKFKMYLQILYEGITDVKLDLDGNDTILVANEPYLEELSQFLDTLTEQQIELFVWFEIVYNFAPHTNINLAILRRRIDEAGKATGISQLRETFCARTTTALMKPAVSYFIVEEPKIEEKRMRAQKMLSALKESFITQLEEITWMDKETKMKAAEKAAEMETYVAFLDKLRDKKELDKDYKHIKIVETTYLNNIRKMLKSEVRKSFGSLRLTFDVEMLSFEMTDVNAYYNPNANNIFVPSGILQFPFYDLGLEALNYGSIGVILGHELTHGFDDTGKKYDKEGNLYDWWSTDSNVEYDSRARCYLNKYSNYTVEQLDRKINGELTLGENIADDGGLNQAFHAYKRYVEENGEEDKLPGMEDYTHEQLFFMSFAHTWCVDYRDMEALEEDMEDAHAPEVARAVIALRNFEEFGKVWSCPRGSKMNPDHERCKMWVD